MSHKTLNQCNNSHDFAHYLAHNGATKVGQCGSHVKWKSPSGAIVIYPDHPGDYGKGLLHSIRKMIMLAGLGLLLMPCCLLYMLANYPHVMEGLCALYVH
jgi:predicted RNA binding protein YcfA (HicA-like mRNA interferase family)